jgi:hypothetical protein
MYGCVRQASWHPLSDLVVVGRYPSPYCPDFTVGEKRTVDILDADTGRMVAQLHDPSTDRLVSVSVSNIFVRECGST